MQKVTLDYYNKGQFEFVVEKYDEDYLWGSFILGEDISRIKEIDKIIEIEDEFWYLDNDGYRLEDEELFKASPWTLLENNKHKKVVSRFRDYSTGKATFSLEPWVRIGDEFNHNPKLKEK